MASRKLTSLLKRIEGVAADVARLSPELRKELLHELFMRLPGESRKVSMAAYEGGEALCKSVDRSEHFEKYPIPFG